MTTLTLAALLVLSPFAASAAQTSAEARENAADSARAHQDLADDQQDLARLESLVDQWMRARDRGSHPQLLQADAKLMAWLEQELSESRRDVATARTEVELAERELAEEKRDLQGRATKTSRDAYEVRDDAHDLEDARRDLAERQSDLAHTERLAGELRQLQERFDRDRASPADFARKAQLLAELRSLAVREVARDRAEVEENRVELHEDQRDR